MNEKKTNSKSQLKKYLDHILKNIPNKPGVYQFSDQSGKTIYVGKAVNLKKRVNSYFKGKKEKSTKTAKMISQIKDIKYTVVGSELEAIMLETNLIKELHPKYNILMKDDKNFVYIKITVNEDYPRIIITRKVEKDKARYFGPKTAQHKVKKILKLLKKIFPYRHCNLNIEHKGQNKNNLAVSDVNVSKASIKYPCIDYHIKRCVAPCIGLVKPEEYKKIINNIIDFLEGRHERIIKDLKQQMEKAASEKKFELAASIRDKLLSIEEISEKQQITTPDQTDIDVINYVITGNKAFFNLFQIRNGKLINQENFQLFQKETEFINNEQRLLQNFIQQYYQKATDLPSEILLPRQIEEIHNIEKWLSEAKGRKVHLLIPHKGRKKELLDLSLQNSKNYAKLTEIKWQGHLSSEREKAINEISKLLNLYNKPKRLECYDISHIGGEKTVASMVVFKDGFPSKTDYRKFKLRQTIKGKPDDYSSMEEALTRRLKHLNPAIVSASIKIQKLKKKDQKNLQKYNKSHSDKNETFKIIKKDKQIGTVKIIPKQQKDKVIIESLSLDETEELQLIFKKIAQKNKTKRLYLKVYDPEIKQYEKIGLQIVKKTPESIKITKNQKLMVFNLIKYQSDNSFSKKPDIIIVDGGKGQLNVAVKVLNKFHLQIPVISIAKKKEEIYLPGRSKPAQYEKHTPLIHMIQHIRDESHRFAVSYQQKLKLKSNKESSLDQIYGVGETTKLKLLKHFGSLEQIKSATMHELEQIVGKKNALLIKKNLL